MIPDLKLAGMAPIRVPMDQFFYFPVSRATWNRKYDRCSAPKVNVDCF